MLAGVSVDYYVRLEQGRERHPSEQVLDALARALQLDDTAAGHLQQLARPPARRRRPSARPQRVRPGVERLMEGWSHTPAIVLGRCLDVLAANSLADALHGHPVRGTNVMRSIFLEPGAQDFYADWDDVARDTVATLRALAGADLDDPRLTELVGELSLKSEDFRRLWARHDVREKTSGTKRFVHPVVGELSLGYGRSRSAGLPGRSSSSTTPNRAAGTSGRSSCSRALRLGTALRACRRRRRRSPRRERRDRPPRSRRAQPRCPSRGGSRRDRSSQGSARRPRCSCTTPG
jgi:hypothetical protein